MPRFDLLLAGTLLLALSVPTANAQRATLSVTARVLPASDVMATGLIAPRPETGHTMVASVRLDANSVVAPTVRIDPTAPVRSGNAFAEFNLGVAVATNVQYQVAVSAEGDALPVQARNAGGRFQSVGRTPVSLLTGSKHGSNRRQEITYRVPVIAGGQSAPAAVTVTLTASSIS